MWRYNICFDWKCLRVLVISISIQLICWPVPQVTGSGNIDSITQYPQPCGRMTKIAMFSEWPERTGRLCPHLVTDKFPSPGVKIIASPAPPCSLVCFVI